MIGFASPLTTIDCMCSAAVELTTWTPFSRLEISSMSAAVPFVFGAVPLAKPVGCGTAALVTAVFFAAVGEAGTFAAFDAAVFVRGDFLAAATDDDALRAANVDVAGTRLAAALDADPANVDDFVAVVLATVFASGLCGRIEIS